MNQKYFHMSIFDMSVAMNLLVGNVNRNKRVSVNVDNQKKHSYAWLPRTCGCNCYNKFEVGQYFKECEWSKILVIDLIVTSNEWLVTSICVA